MILLFSRIFCHFFNFVKSHFVFVPVLCVSAAESDPLLLASKNYLEILFTNHFFLL